MKVNKRLIVIVLVGLLIFGFIIKRSYNSLSKKSRADSEVMVIDFDKTVKASRYQDLDNVVSFSLYSKDDTTLINVSQPSLGIVSLAGRDLKVKNGVSLDTIIPRENFSQLSLVAKKSDSEDPYLKSHGFSLKGEHFFYNQNFNGIPVYAGQVFVHFKDGNDLTGIEGNIIKGFNEIKAQLTDDQAKEIAVKKSREEAGSQAFLKVVRADRYIFNKRVVGLGDDESNRLVLAVSVTGDYKTGTFFGKRYFVDLVNGTVVHSESLTRSVLNRAVADYPTCSGNTCKGRQEGGASYGKADVDNTYAILGSVYNYYKQTYSRDSYDNKGSQIVAYAYYNGNSCPNAFWLPEDEVLVLCSGMAMTDIVTHEYTHGVEGDSLSYTYQSGALAESISDIFANALDDNWTMGEGSTVGVIRRMDDPTKYSQPDKLFSGSYSCGSSDDGGVHANEGIINKAFYLMATGGSFNGCSISGISRAKAHPIIYRALTYYLSQSANFLTMYNAVLRACSDLYGSSNPSYCVEVDKAMRAVEIDQQPAGTQQGPTCSGIGEKTPQCNITTPTVTQSVTVTVTPTKTPTPSTSVTPTKTPTPTAVPTKTPIPTATPTPTATPSPTPMPTCSSSGSVVLSLKLKFQGISKKPASAKTIRVNLQALSNQGAKATGCGDLTSNDNGLWTGNVYLDIKDQYLNDTYRLFIKGFRHIQKKICENAPVETLSGSYRCDEGKITLKKGQNAFDFSGITLLVGDLPEQDGVVNSYDTSLVTNNLGKKDDQSLWKADLNMDGVVDTQDYSLIIAALSVRFDEE
ncbi:hypothetical protein GYA28_03365 [Candidatus Roizmanbacteria bacterium]|nr:hypothetical protein [Candidatus Roizmanbacteria bacterium]